MVTKTKDDIETKTKKICTSRNHKISKRPKKIQDVMHGRRRMNVEHLEYSELIKTIKKEIRKNLCNYNAEQSKQNIENKKNMKMSNKINRRIRHHHHQRKNDRNNQVTETTKNFYKQLHASTSPKPNNVKTDVTIKNAGLVDLLEITLDEISFAHLI